ncbi:MAG: hypothetical protein ABJP33_10370 [Pseudoruegeria sp.]
MEAVIAGRFFAPHPQRVLAAGCLNPKKNSDYKIERDGAFQSGGGIADNRQAWS